MSVGIIQKEKMTVVEVKDSGGSVVIEKSYLQDNGNQDYKHAAIGLPLDNFIIKNLYLPNVTKKELLKTIELQLEFHVPNHEIDYYTSYITKTCKSGYLLLIIAVKKTVDYKKAKAIIPVPVGLFAFAVSHKLFDKNENALLVYISEGTVITVAVQNGELVFMREFLSESNEKIKQRIQLSSQAVYLQHDRHFIDLNKIIVVCQDKSFKDIVAEAVDEKINVQWFDSSSFEKKDIGNLFLNAGVALFHPQNKAMSGWNVAKKPPGTRESLKRILIYAIPVLIIFLPIYYYAGYYSRNSEIKSIQARIDQYDLQLGNVDVISGKVAQGKAYIEAIGGPTLNFARIDKLFNVIDECRSDNLWVVSISGKLGGLFVVNGVANSYTDITNFIKNLEVSNFIDNINLNYSNEASGQNVNYQLTLRLSQDNSFILKPLTKEKKDLKDKKSDDKSNKPEMSNNTKENGKKQKENLDKTTVQEKKPDNSLSSTEGKTQSKNVKDKNNETVASSENNNIKKSATEQENTVKKEELQSQQESNKDENSKNFASSENSNIGNGSTTAESDNAVKYKKLQQQPQGNNDDNSKILENLQNRNIEKSTAEPDNAVENKEEISNEELKANNTSNTDKKTGTNNSINQTDNIQQQNSN